MNRRNNKITYYDFIKEMAVKSGKHQTECRQMVTWTFATIADVISRGDSIIVPGFGRFCTLKTAARRGTDPNSLNEVIWGSATIPKFYASKNLREKVNNKFGGKAEIDG